MFFLVCISAMIGGCGHPSRETNSLSVGVLEFGTAGWEMSVMHADHLAIKHGVRLKVVRLASKNALGVALHGGRVDMIVSDWLWVARQDANGADYQFFPYSQAVGAVMVNPRSKIKTLANLAGKKIGIAGGPLDKTWLLLRAYARKSAGLELAKIAHPVYAAPPILNQLLTRGALPAVINYWQYDARAQAAGMVPLVTVKTMLTGLDIDTTPPLLGWTFSAKWAKQHGPLLRSFLTASYATKDLLRDSRSAWTSIRKLVKPSNSTVAKMIRKQYKAGIPSHYGKPQIDAARQLFHILALEGGAELTGGTRQLPAHLFWRGMALP